MPMFGILSNKKGMLKTSTPFSFIYLSITYSHTYGREVP